MEDKLRKIIRSELRNLKTERRGSSYEDAFADKFYDERDGWNERQFDSTGLMDALSDAAKLSYEIKNARRGSYALGSDHPGDVIDYIDNIISKLEGAIRDIEHS